MRKADYAALAAILRAQYTHAVCAEISDEKRKEYWQGQKFLCEGIAEQFASRASVNRAEFLKACGIEP